MISKKMLIGVVLFWVATWHCPICLYGENRGDESWPNVIRTAVDGIWRETADGIAIFASQEHLKHIETLAPLPDESLPGDEPPTGDISLDFSDTDLSEIFSLIQTKAKANIILAKEVKGSVARVKCSDIPWKRVLVLLAGSMGFDVRQHHSIIFIGSANTLEQITKLPLPTLPGPGKRISMNLRNIDLKEVCKLVVKMNSRNIIFEKSVRGNINVNLRDVSETEAVAAITRANGVDCRHENGIWLIAPHKELERYQAPNFYDQELDNPEHNVSLDFRDTDIREILKLVAQKMSQNIICAKGVRGTISLTIGEVSAAKVIQTVSALNGYDSMRHKWIWVIAEPMALTKVRQNLEQMKFPDTDKLIDLDFRDTDIVRLIKSIESKLNMPVVVSPHVQGKTSVKLTGVPIMEALACITWASGYDVSFEDDQIEIK